LQSLRNMTWGKVFYLPTMMIGPMKGLYMPTEVRGFISAKSETTASITK